MGKAAELSDMLADIDLIYGRELLCVSKPGNLEGLTAGARPSDVEKEERIEERTVEPRAD